jgi:hypothetical protein
MKLRNELESSSACELCAYEEGSVAEEKQCYGTS